MVNKVAFLGKSTQIRSLQNNKGKTKRVSYLSKFADNKDGTH